jgi:hypothetical protein
VSKNWQIRARAYDEIASEFNSAANPSDDCFRDHCDLWKNYLNDNNPGALEKCLDALLVFLDKADPKIVAASKNEMIKALVEKCLTHAKASIKMKASECFMLCFEVCEVFEDISETLIETLNSKQQKVSYSNVEPIDSSGIDRRHHGLARCLWSKEGLA